MKEARLNVLWIMSDQHNAGAMGCAGHPDVRTPHLDALARDGVRFSQAFCNNPVCAPSRACFITGQYCHTHGITGNDVFNYTATRPLTVAEHFRKNGYQTALVGKGHLPKLWMEDGFEHRRYCDLADCERNDPLSNHYFADLVQAGLADQYDHGKLNPPHPGARMRAFTSPIPDKHSLETWTGDKTLEFLGNRDSAPPFFVQMSFQRPHDPHAISPEWVDWYDASSLTLPDSISDFFDTKFQSKPAFMRNYVREGHEGYPYRPYDQADLKRQLAHYYALITAMDREIGRVIAHLKATGQYDNTVIVYHADHGDFSGEHGLALKNFGVYESVHKIPYIWRWPGAPTGTTVEGIVESVDLYATLCDVAGLPCPPEVEGRSLRGLVDGSAAGLDHTVAEFDFPIREERTVVAVRENNHRLVYYLNDPDDGELYDRVADPGEVNNLYRDSALQDVRERLIRKALNHVLGFKRNWSFQDDGKPEKTGKPGLAALIHRGKTKWSDVSRFYI